MQKKKHMGVRETKQIVLFSGGASKINSKRGKNLYPKIAKAVRTSAMYRLKICIRKVTYTLKYLAVDVDIWIIWSSSAKHKYFWQSQAQEQGHLTQVTLTMTQKTLLSQYLRHLGNPPKNPLSHGNNNDATNVKF